MHVDGRNKHLNVINGNFLLKIQKGAWINSRNKITGASLFKDKVNEFVMEAESSVIVHHVFDVSDDIIIGEKSCMAGYGSQIWTHSFVFGTKGKAALVTKPVVIGKNVYIGSQCIICPGVSVADNIVVGAHTTVSKSLSQQGLYVSQGLKYMPYNADEIIEEIEKKGVAIFLSDKIL